jgi:hypothetical protein
MPNQPRTPNYSFRLPGELMDAYRKLAADRGTTLTVQIIDALWRGLGRRKS